MVKWQNVTLPVSPTKNLGQRLAQHRPQRESSLWMSFVCHFSPTSFQEMYFDSSTSSFIVCFWQNSLLLPISLTRAWGWPCWDEAEAPTQGMLVEGWLFNSIRCIMLFYEMWWFSVRNSCSVHRTPTQICRIFWGLDGRKVLSGCSKQK